MKSLLHEGDKRLTEVLGSQVLPDKTFHCGEKTVEWRRISSMEGESAQSNEEKAGGSSKADRKEQQTKEIQSKLKLLSQYGQPASSPRILSPASFRTHKPFRVPLKKPQQNTTTTGVEEQN